MERSQTRCRGALGDVSRAGRCLVVAVVLLALTPRAGQGQQAAVDTAAAAIDRVLAEGYPAGGPGAAVVVTRAGRVMLRKGYGLAHVQAGTTVTPETVFRIASVTKVFTATAILMLADQGRIALDSPVTTYLPDLPTAGRGVTIRHLLSHSSGLAEYLDRPDFTAFIAGEHAVQDLIAAFSDRPHVFPPGERDAYSNSNYILLGAILERVSGMVFGDLVRTRFFEPLGMRSTACVVPLGTVRGLAEAYEPARDAAGQPDWSRFVVARPYTMSALYAAGGCVSSVDDLLRFHEALFGGRLLLPETLAHSLEPVRLTGGRLGGTSYGGWQLDRVAGRRAAMKGGSMPGACTWILTMPDDSLVVVLLTNRTPGQPRCGMLTVRLAGIAIGG